MSDFGVYGNSELHARYMQPVPPRSRRRCKCGCRKRATHIGMANGVGMVSACELYARRWIRDGDRARCAKPPEGM